MIKSKYAYVQGYDAFNEGLSDDFCPYASNTHQYEIWLNGWNDAYNNYHNHNYYDYDCGY